MYVCGPTVYDHAHIGNARPIIVFDVLFRLLRHIYGADRVVYARNITDIDDKINARAKEEGVPISQITSRTTAQFHQDVAALGALKPTVEPRATDHIAQMIDMIETLIEKGCAYAADGHVLFHVPSMKSYGQLARRSMDEMVAGARVDVAPYKKDPMDFVLWKPSDKSLPGWDSPWGRGRPGWHIECSAMARRHLGETFDIHGGGIDLVFPHHENEIAQSCCAHDTKVMANYWLHNGHLQVEGEKMSKSLGNFLTISDLLKEYPGEALRLNMLSTHYRQPFNWTAASASTSSTPRCATARRRGRRLFRGGQDRRSPRMLDELGIDYVEGGYPGANPTDTEFFRPGSASKQAAFTAFGMTKRPGARPPTIPALRRCSSRRRRHLLRRQEPGTITSRRARHHATRRTSNASATAAPPRGAGREAFCSTASISSTATRPIRTTRCLRQGGLEAGARWVVLCDTNGGTLPHEVERIVAAVSRREFRATGSASTPMTTPARRSPIRSPPCAPARARSRARSTASASAAATPTSSRSSRR
jgi:hypothetical protein